MARGGYRPGAGRPKGSTAKNKAKKPKKRAPKIPKKVVAEATAEDLDPLSYMLGVMNDPKVDVVRRDRMAIAAAPFVHARKGEGAGKKEEKADKAKSAGAGKFSAGRPPIALVK